MKKVDRNEKGQFIKGHSNLNKNGKGQFKKGCVSWNKGKKMSPGQYEKCKKTMFKKGNIPSSYRKIGSERIEAKDGYVLIKVADPNKWKLKHRYLYEKAYGKIPKGYIVIFKDGNKYNFDSNNLVAVSRSELLIMNKKGLIKDKQELTETGVLIAKVIDKTNKLKKGEENVKNKR